MIQSQSSKQIDADLIILQGVSMLLTESNCGPLARPFLQEKCPVRHGNANVSDANAPRLPPSPKGREMRGISQLRNRAVLFIACFSRSSFETLLAFSFLLP